MQEDRARRNTKPLVERYDELLAKRSRTNDRAERMRQQILDAADRIRGEEGPPPSPAPAPELTAHEETPPPVPEASEVPQAPGPPPTVSRPITPTTRNSGNPRSVDSLFVDGMMGAHSISAAQLKR